MTTGVAPGMVAGSATWKIGSGEGQVLALVGSLLIPSPSAKPANAPNTIADSTFFRSELIWQPQHLAFKN
jgi:hypothetical protein